jgi:DNA-binding CsgD family transcriptional regulator/tetratricopeptide (TPR) repeat protein
MKSVLVGRDHEMAVLRSYLADARMGTSSVLVLEGDPGIGKSALLAEARQATEGVVLSTAGVETESDIAYVNLADVFRHHYSYLKSIPERQADALASVFAIGPSKPADRFTVAAATLTLLAAIAANGPVLVTIDDAQWVDQASLGALTFAANRLEAEGIVLMFAVRPGQPVAQRLSRFLKLTIGGLDVSAARAVVARAAPVGMSDASTSRLVEESGGNPLALLTLPATMKSEDFAMWAMGAEPLPISSVIEDAFRGNIQVLPNPTRQALCLLAIMESSGIAQHFRSALEAERRSADDLDPAEDAGLIVYRLGQPEFRHPLVRAAAYRTSSAADRRRAHLLAARMLEQSASSTILERRAWHLVAARTAPNEALAQTFQIAADNEFTTGNFTVAGKLYKRSSELTPAGNSAMRRMLQAANALRLAGAIDEVQPLLRDAMTLGDDPELRAAIEYALYRRQAYAGAMIDGRDGLLKTGAAAAKRQPAQAAQVLADAALASTVIGDLPAARTTAEQAIGLARDPGRDPPLAVAAVNAMVKAISGDPVAARRLIHHRAAEIDALDPLGIDFGYQVPLLLSIAHLASEEADRARIVLARAVEGARERSAVGILPFRLGSLGRIEFWQGRWANALAMVHEALRLADDTGWTTERPSNLATLARIEALTGHPGEARAHALEAITASETVGARTYLAFAQIALGVLEFTAGNPTIAISHFGEVSAFCDEVGYSNSPLMWWSSDLLECYVSDGMDDVAQRELGRLEQAAANPSMPTTAAVAARSRALLEPTAFEEHMTEALRLHSIGDMPFEQARTELMLGQHLRRHNQPTNARTQLSSALGRFEWLGAPDWANRARSELQATGVRMPQPTTAGLATLTPQELQVTLAVARGLSNREVASQLFLSTKTVEFHLSNVFQKLGISRRTRLAAIVAKQASLPVSAAS